MLSARVKYHSICVNNTTLRMLTLAKSQSLYAPSKNKKARSVVQNGTASAPVSLHRAGKSLNMSLDGDCEPCHFAPAHHAHTPPPQVQGKASGKTRKREGAGAIAIRWNVVGLQVRVPAPAAHFYSLDDFIPHPIPAPPDP